MKKIKRIKGVYRSRHGRARVSRKVSRRLFSRTGKKTHRKNLKKNLAYGGFSL